MRINTVEFAGKQITVREKKIKELQELLPQLGIDFEKISKTETSEIFAMANNIPSLLKDKLTVIFPEITESDIQEAYPSEIEDLISVFIETNFTGVKKVASPLLTLALKYLSSSQKN
jgi:hypothetical protein